MLGCDSIGCEFDCRPFHCQEVTILGKLSLIPVAGQQCLATGKVTHRSGVALVMHHGLKWFIHLRANGRGAPHLCSSWDIAPFTFTYADGESETYLVWLLGAKRLQSDECLQTVRLLAWYRPASIAAIPFLHTVRWSDVRLLQELSW